MELKDYINIVRSRKLVIIGAIVIVVVAAMIFTLLQAAVYESRVDILINSSQTVDLTSGNLVSASNSDSQLFVLTQARIIATKAMAEAVWDRLQSNYEELANQQADARGVFIPASIPSPEDLGKSIKVQQLQNTNVFEIAASSGNPLLSKDIAQAYAEQFILDRQTSAVAKIDDLRKELWNQIQEMQTQIDNLAQQAKQYPAGNVPPELTTETQQATSRQANLYERYNNLGISEALQQKGLEIIEPAVAGKKVKPNIATNIIIGGLIGIVMGFALAFLVDYVDNTVKTREDFEKYYGTSIISEIPHMPIPNGKARKIIYFGKPESPTAEGCRNLRTNLQFMNLEGKVRLVMITSASPEEGKTFVAVNLAAAMSEMGDKVVVVDADLRRPALEKFMERVPEKGLTDVIMGTSSAYAAVVRTEYENLGMMMSGRKPPNPAALVASQAMDSLLQELEASCDYVFVDAPPVLAANDAVAMAPMMDGVILVASPGKTSREEARRTIKLLSKVDTKILGLVIVIEPGSRYDYGGYQYYSYGERSEKRGRWQRLRRKKQTT